MYLNQERKCKSQQNLRNSYSPRISDGLAGMRDGTVGVAVRKRASRSVLSSQSRRKSLNLISASFQAAKSKSKDILKFIYDRTGHNQEFANYDYLCIRVLLQDHFMLMYPSMCYYMSGKTAELVAQLHSLVQWYGDVPAMCYRILLTVIEQMKQLSIITEVQANKLKSMSQTMSPSIRSCYQSFRDNDSLTSFQKGLLQLVKADPLGPPAFSLSETSSRLSFLEYRPSEIDWLSVRLLYAMDNREISNHDVLCLLQLCVENPRYIKQLQSLTIISASTVKPMIQTSIPDISLRELMGAKDSYPEQEIQLLLQSLSRSSRCSVADYSELISLCKKKSLSLYYCYLRYVVTSSQSLFLSLCQIFLKHAEGKEISELVIEQRTRLPCDRHEAILQTLVTKGYLSENEAWVIMKEYMQDESSVVRQAFAVNDVREDLNEFAFVIKKMATLYTMN